ncbi:MAG: DUF2804 domain-containing protein [Clostridia bacterium]|nr:DUF2804 domain-containing protein [Clostridia bacterium]
MERDWDCYTVISPTNNLGVILNVSRAGHLGIHSATFIDFSIPWDHSEHITKTYPGGKPKFNSYGTDGSTVYKNDPIDFEFRTKHGETRLLCNYKKFYKRKELSCYILLKNKINSFGLLDNCLVETFDCSGKVSIYGKDYDLSPDTDFAIRTSGRNGTASGEGHRGCFGFGYADSKPFTFYFVDGKEKMSDNSYIYDGKLYNTDEFFFKIPEEILRGTRNYYSRSGAFKGDFYPQTDFSFKNDLGIFASDRHTIIGSLNGSFEIEGGKRVSFENAFCLTEHIRKKLFKR